MQVYIHLSPVFPLDLELLETGKVDSLDTYKSFSLLFPDDSVEVVRNPLFQFLPLLQSGKSFSFYLTNALTFHSLISFSIHVTFPFYQFFRVGCSFIEIIL